MKMREIKKIEGMCVTKNRQHYHAALFDEQAKDWYLNNWWKVSVGHCHESSERVIAGNPYTDWID